MEIQDGRRSSVQRSEVVVLTPQLLQRGIMPVGGIAIPFLGVIVRRSGLRGDDRRFLEPSR